MEDKKCFSCGSDDIVFDDSSAETRYVCTSCGTIVEDCAALSSVNTAGTSYVPHDGCNLSGTLRKYNRTSVPLGKKQGLEKIAQLASIFNISHDMKGIAKDLFSQAYKHLFRKESISKKLILAGCSVYVVMRQYDRPVIYQDLCQHLDCSPKQFYAIYKLFEKFRGTKVSQQTTDEFVRVALRDMKIDDKERFLKRVIEVINICYKCWLVSGQNRRHNVIAAAYIAWVSSDNSCINVKLCKFFSRFLFPKELLRTTQSRVNDMCSVFIKHAEKLPWVEDSIVDSKKVFLYVDYVLKHFRDLHDSVMSKQRTSTECDIDVLKYKTFRPETVKRNKRLRCSVDAFQHPDLAGKTDSCNGDISDTEIEKYIRSHAEVTEFNKFQGVIRGTPYVPKLEQNNNSSDSCNDKGISDIESFSDNDKDMSDIESFSDYDKDLFL